MKATSRSRLWKAIAFLTIFFISFLVSCCDEPEIPTTYPSITLVGTENITANSAILVAKLTTKSKSLFVLFEYFDEGEWKLVETEFYGSNQTFIVKKEISGLSRGKTYEFRAQACYKVYNGPSIYFAQESKDYAQKSFTTLDPSLLTIKEMKSDFTSISVKLELIPKAANTKVQLDYTVNGSVQTKLSGSYSGNSAVEVNFKLDNLVKNTDYQIKIKTINEFAVEVDTIFKTCAVSDFDGNAYRIVTIGNQVWLQENFRGTHFANGDAIPNVTDQAQWDTMKTPAYCWYNNDSKIGEVYGGLYNWYVASDLRGLIVGYHAPAQSEWKVLADYLGGEEVAGGKMKESGYAHWIQPNAGADNSSGFCGLPGGARKSSFGNIGDASVFWSITVSETVNMANVSTLGETSTLMQFQGGSYYFRGHGIRLVKN